jgi:glutamate dehydrogenase (NAD(P)+)
MTTHRRPSPSDLPSAVQGQRAVFEDLGIDRDPTSLFHQSIEQMLAAADLVGLKHHYRLILSQAQSEVTVNIPVCMDDGEHRVFTGWRVQHNSVNGPYKGGLRFHPSCNLDTMRSLALLMTLKCSLLRLPFGGAFGGVRCSTRELTRRELERVTRRFAWAISNQVGPDYDVVGPGVGTDPQVMAWFTDTYSQAAPAASRADAQRVASGKPVEMGGCIGRSHAGGVGLVEVLREMLPDYGIQPADMSVAIAGFGNVGRSTAVALAGIGARVVAVLDRNGAIVNMRGLDPEDLAAYQEDNGSLDGYDDGDFVSTEQFWQVSSDVLVPAALERMLDAKVAETVRTKIVAEVGSSPVTPDAESVLLQRGIEVLPSVLCNGGGVTVSYFEWMQNRTANPWTTTRVAEQLSETMVAASRRVKLARHRYECDLRTAAYCAALERIGRVYDLRNIWP